MRTTLYAVGAFLFLAYPLFMLFAVAHNIDNPKKSPPPAAITFTSRSTRDLLEPDMPQRNRGGLRNTTLRRSGN